MAVSLTPEEYEQRNLSIMEDFNAGRATYTELGHRHKLTTMRIRQIIASMERKAKRCEGQQRLVDAFLDEAERMKVIIEHRRAIYDEIKAAFGWRWRRPSPAIQSMLALPTPEQLQLRAKEREKAEQKRLRSLYQKTMKAERARWSEIQEIEHHARTEVKARRAKLTRYLHRSPIDWVMAGRIIVRDLQRDFIPDSQHWPLVHLGPDGILWLDQTFRALVRDQYANRDVIRVEP